MRRIGGTRLSVTGFLACPCHLIVTLPLLISLLAGTALGSFLSRNTGLVYTGAGIYFVVALALGVFFLFGSKRQSNRGETACSSLSFLRIRINLNPGSPRNQRICLSQGDNIDVNPRAL
jgi:mercuric ion transport protein